MTARAALSSSPLVSIVTPSLNQGQFIEDALRSVREQSYRNVEHIVMDGGSTDGTLEILRRHDSELAHWVSEPDGGHADAVNKGWRAADGEILAFLNADDYYLPGALERVVDEFRSHPNSPMVHGQGVWVDVKKNPLMQTSLFVTPDSFCRQFPGIPQPAAFFTRWVVDEVGPLDVSFEFALDGEFFSRILGRYTIRSLPHPLAALRIHPAAKSSATGVRFSAEVRRIAAKIVGQPSQYPLFDAEPDHIYASALITAARFEALNRCPRAALRHLMAASALGGRSERARMPLELAKLSAATLLRAEVYRASGQAFRRRKARIE